jgi:hypothetical protein
MHYPLVTLSFFFFLYKENIHHETMNKKDEKICIKVVDYLLTLILSEKVTYGIIYYNHFSRYQEKWIAYGL